jgi:D-threonate/D-erythronate kinase
MVCAVIADDLTGACDSAVQFANVGLRTVVALDGRCHADVVAYSTDSRDKPCAMPAIEPGPIVFKKIDSTLRGNTRAEILAALDAFGFDTAIVNPAFPEMGRVVENGWLRVTTDPTFQPIHLPAFLDDPRCIVVDDFPVDPARRVLWAGSAGMATALARKLGNGSPGDLPRTGPVLFCIGSDHPVTLRQERKLLDSQRACVLRVARDRFTPPAGRPGAFFLCGGDTASMVCRSLGVRSIELRRELRRGIPGGILRGGLYDGTPVVTKSGGFGAPDDLIHIADYFHE